MRESLPEDLVSGAVRRVLTVPKPAAGPVVHSDRGSQCAATTLKSLPVRHEAVQSMSRRGNHYDKTLPDATHAESFWSRLKTAPLDGGSFRNPADARLEISHHVAGYNAKDGIRSSATWFAANLKPTLKSRPNFRAA